jgi:hypothetical protein
MQRKFCVHQQKECGSFCLLLWQASKQYGSCKKCAI